MPRPGVPVVPGTDAPVTSVEEVGKFAAAHGYPIMLKATFGGGGRGVRVVRSETDVAEALERAQERSAGSLRAWRDLLRETPGATRSTSRCRFSPIPMVTACISSSATARCNGAIRKSWSSRRLFPSETPCARSSTRPPCESPGKRDYVNAGTVEFLVGSEGYYFIEVNPRIQVEHTVTECITGRDLVQAQIRVAEGHHLERSGDRYRQPGSGDPARIRRAVPHHHPRTLRRVSPPDTGKIRAYRAATGFGIRLDDGTGGAGTLVSSHYDSLLVKVTAFAPQFHDACAKLLRSLREFRIRGVMTNTRFLENVISHPQFLSGDTNTVFLDETPELFEFPPGRDRGTKLLRAFANAVVNGPPGLKGPVKRPPTLFAPIPPAIDPAMTSRPPEDGAGHGGLPCQRCGRALPLAQRGIASLDHRYDVPGRAPVAARHARSDRGYAGHCAGQPPFLGAISSVSRCGAGRRSTWPIAS